MDDLFIHSVAFSVNMFTVIDPYRSSTPIGIMKNVSQKNLIKSIIEMNKGKTTAPHVHVIKMQKTDNTNELKKSNKTMYFISHLILECEI